MIKEVGGGKSKEGGNSQVKKATSVSYGKKKSKLCELRVGDGFKAELNLYVLNV